MPSAFRDDPLVRSLALLKGHIVTLHRTRDDIKSNLDGFDECTKGLSRQARDVNSKLGQLEGQVENISATRRTVVKVADKFNDIAKAKAMLDRGWELELAELISSVDALREAVRYAESLSRSAQDSRTQDRLSDQQNLLKQAAKMLDFRLRSLLTTHIRPADFKIFLQKRTASLMDPAEQRNLADIVTRVQDGDYLQEFSDKIRTALQASLATAVAAEDEQAARSLYNPGGHPVLEYVNFYQALLREAEGLGAAIFGADAWRAFQCAVVRDEPEFLLQLCAVDTLRQNVVSAMQSSGKHDHCDRIYIHLDICLLFEQHDWRGLPVSSSRTSCPGQMWNALKLAVHKESRAVVEKYCDYLVSPPQQSQSDGSILDVLLQATHLLSHLTKHYGEGLFDAVHARSDSRFCFYQDFVNEVIKHCRNAIDTRSIALRDKSKAGLAVVFRLNNIHHLWEKLRDLNMAWIDKEHAEGLQMEVLDLKRRYIASVWEPVGEIVSERRSITSMSSDSRAWIKKRFGAFNDAFESRHKDDCDLTVPNPELRRELVSAVMRTVLVPYQRFSDSYGNLAFSSQKEKYVKYAQNGAVHPLQNLINELLSGDPKKKR
eukprot:TRINITY_DN26530_c0_g4_i1.p1 TRINITY_DN26530_c0_g4~~TRINITY_DN26530_c0_g4_i1.p1  ORF type:complete len:602 (+),score=213.80 TRINITY_DN26530_c0_g4_i1:138-1943(+)